MNRKVWSVIAVLLWLLVPILMFVVILYGTFVVPGMVGQFKAQGLKELPVHLQLIVDLSDLCLHRWFLVFPLLIVAAGFATWNAVRK